MLDFPLRAWRSLVSTAARALPSRGRFASNPQPSRASLEETLCKLAIAVKHNDIEDFSSHLGQAVRLNASNARLDCSAAVQLALEHNRLALLERLLDAGADPDNAGLIPAIHRAAERVSEPALRLLARHGADLNQRDHHGRTPLIRACAEGRPESVHALIDLGADLDALSGRNICAMSAAFESAVKIKRLVEQDSRPELSRHRERYEEHLACALALLNAGANPFIGSPSLSPISAAIDLNEPALARSLLALCPRPDRWLLNLSTASRAPGSESAWAHSLVRRYDPTAASPAKQTLEQLKNEARTLIEARAISESIASASSPPARADRTPRL